MKKRKKAGESTKEKAFATTPFKALKGYAAESSQPENLVVPQEASRAIPPLAEDDRALFLRHMDDVRRLDGGAPRKCQQPQVDALADAPLAAAERHVFLAALTGMDVSFRDEFPEVAPIRPLAVNRMRQLKSGAIRIDLELDLHGLTREEALCNLGQFITGAFNRGQKAVLVITGKGNNSPVEPVLQGAVASWLRDAGKTMVAEFAPAPRQMGGSGAYVVFLKERKEKAGER
jgi:DNA-nicking Smr family endonuclease